MKFTDTLVKNPVDGDTPLPYHARVRFWTLFLDAKGEHIGESPVDIQLDKAGTGIEIRAIEGDLIVEPMSGNMVRVRVRQ